VQWRGVVLGDPAVHELAAGGDTGNDELVYLIHVRGPLKRESGRSLLPSRSVPDDVRTPAEELLRRSRIDETGDGQPLSERARQRQRSIEAYLRGEALPRYMQRAAEIDRAVRRHLEMLRRAYERPEQRARWREVAESWDFREVNHLIHEHNEWYPVERDLPMNPRTKDYVLINGHSYRREVLGPAWILERFPV
jgi:hypothetical protein